MFQENLKTKFLFTHYRPSNKITNCRKNLIVADQFAHSEMWPKILVSCFFYPDELVHIIR